MDMKIWGVVTVLAAFGCFWAGWAAGSHHTGVLDAKLVLSMFHLEQRNDEVPAVDRKERKKEPDPDELRRREELQRAQDLLDNIDAFGTNVPQKEIKRRSGV